MASQTSPKTRTRTAPCPCRPASRTAGPTALLMGIPTRTKRTAHYEPETHQTNQSQATGNPAPQSGCGQSAFSLRLLPPSFFYISRLPLAHMRMHGVYRSNSHTASSVFSFLSSVLGFSIFGFNCAYLFGLFIWPRYFLASRPFFVALPPAEKTAQGCHPFVEPASRITVHFHHIRSGKPHDFIGLPLLLLSTISR